MKYNKIKENTLGEEFTGAGNLPGGKFVRGEFGQVIIH